jgi:hypothetical protein
MTSEIAADLATNPPVHAVYFAAGPDEDIEGELEDDWDDDLDEDPDDDLDDEEIEDWSDDEQEHTL